MPMMVPVFVGGIAILSIVAVGSAITAIRARRWAPAAFWTVAGLFLLGWLYGIAAGLLAADGRHAFTGRSDPQAWMVGLRRS